MIWRVDRHSFLLLGVMMIGICLAVAGPAPADIIHIPGDYPTIQAGIYAAVDGDTVMVAPGEYIERINFLGKAIHVRSEEGPLQTLIDDGPGVGSVVTFSSGEGRDSVLEGFTIRGGSGTHIPALDLRCGGGILCLESSPSITGNVICHNGGQTGSGIFCENSSAIISGNVIRHNDADGTYDWVYAYGGGVCLFYCGTEENPLLLTNNLIIWNLAIGFGAVYESIGYGGGVYAGGGVLVIDQCTIAYNEAACDGGGDTYGGGLLSYNQETIVSNSIFRRNRSVLGDEIALFYDTFRIDYSTVQGGWSGAYNDSCDMEWGAGMMDVDPLFIDWSFLTQQSAGQLINSQCVDAGDPEAPPMSGSTRTDLGPDKGRVDLGFHYPSDWPHRARLLAGAGPAENNPPVVRVFPVGETSEPELELVAYGTPRFGVNVTAADLDGGDYYSEIITGAGPGDVFGPHVRGFTVDGAPLAGLNFLAYGTNRFGVNVTAGDLDGDHNDEIITGAGPGDVFGPHVRGFVYEVASGVSPLPGVSFFAYGTPKWGVNVACGNIKGNWADEIITGAGPGSIYGPHVRAWSVEDGQAVAIPEVSFLAYGTNQMGVRVTCGDVDGDGLDEIITAPGPSSAFGAHIRGWNCDGDEITPMPGIDFFAWPAGEAMYGASVSARCDINRNGTDDLVVGEGPAPDGNSRINVYSCNRGTLTLWYSLSAFPEDWTHGVNVAAGQF